MSEYLINLDTKIWRHDSDFFYWVKDAQACVFVVDLGMYFPYPKDYTADISKSIRSAWQKVLEMNSNQIDEIYKKPIVLIFNKADLLVETIHNRTDSIFNKKYT